MSQKIWEKNKNDNQFLENVFYKFYKNGIKMREYHVDTRKSFSDKIKYKKTLSIRRDPSTRPIMMMDQDESIFKQYNFVRKC